MSPNELYEALDALAKDRYEHTKLDMERMRLQTFYLVNLQLDSNSRLNDVKELMRFPWDEEEYNENDVVVPDWQGLENKLKGLV